MLHDIFTLARLCRANLHAESLAYSAKHSMIPSRLVDDNLAGSKHSTQWYKPLYNFTKTFQMLSILTIVYNSSKYYYVSE